MFRRMCICVRVCVKGAGGRGFTGVVGRGFFLRTLDCRVLDFYSRFTGGEEV